MHSNRTHWDIYVIFVATLALAFGLRYVTFAWGPVDSLVGFQNVFFAGLEGSVAVIAAFVPERRFVGLLWTTAYSLAYSAVRSLADRLAMGQWDDYSLSMPTFPLVVLIVAQGLRCALGWRVTREAFAADRRAGQLHIVDALEWTAAFAAWFGFAQFWDLPLQNARGFAMITLETMLICVPIALVATREQGFTFRALIALVVWACAVRMLVVAIGVTTSWRPTAAPYWYLALNSAVVIPAWFLSAGVIFALLHRLGYRWRTPRRSEVTSGNT